jgi:transcriptional regulator with XRE-family HTH domain
MFGAKLLEIRNKMGFSSALSFYQSLEARAQLDFNYAYYKKIENGEKLPSVKIVHHLISLLPKSYGDELILSFCEAQFPARARLFKSAAKDSTDQSIKSQPKTSRAQKKAATIHTVIGQQELTERQVAVIASSSHHFYLFSLITLARRALQYQELVQLFGDRLDHCLKELVSVKLIYRDGESVLSSYPEYRYPRAETKGLKEAYSKLDEFDLSKIEFFKLQKKTRGQFFRRISPRYLDLITNSIELLYQTIRMADDFDSNQNDVVCSLSVSLHSGELPG